jgi:hypothetical protein
MTDVHPEAASSSIDPPLPPGPREPVVEAAAAVSLGLGVALLLAPGLVARVLGVAPDRRLLRAIGLVDLVLAPGLWFGRPRWPWLTARALSNPAIAVVAATRARSLRARLLAAGLVGATVMDLRTADRLRSEGR